MPNFEEVKILLLGDSGVGKSSLFYRFKSGSFIARPAQSLANYIFKTAKIQGKEIKISVWDLSGQGKHRSIISGYYEKAEGVLLVYDVTDFNTFERLGEWLDEFKSINSTAEVIIVGNKNEIGSRNSVTVSDARKFAEDGNLQYAEVSARSGENVDKVFVFLAERVLMARGIFPFTGDAIVSEQEKLSEVALSTSMASKRDKSNDARLLQTLNSENMESGQLKMAEKEEQMIPLSANSLCTDPLNSDNVPQHHGSIQSDNLHVDYIPQKKTCSCCRCGSSCCIIS